MQPIPSPICSEVLRTVVPRRLSSVGEPDKVLSNRMCPKIFNRKTNTVLGCQGRVPEGGTSQECKNWSSKEKWGSRLAAWGQHTQGTAAIWKLHSLSYPELGGSHDLMPLRSPKAAGATHECVCPQRPSLGCWLGGAVPMHFISLDAIVGFLCQLG